MSFSITTRQGDAGKTRLFSGEEISKCSARTEAYGALDETVSILGIARSLTQEEDLSETIMCIQRSLFVAGSEMATTPEYVNKLPARIDQERLALLDTERDALEKSITMPQGFILPGGHPVAAHLDHARAVARRCERHAVALQENGEIDNPHLLVWLNRLSDFLWLLARHVEGGKVMLK